MVLMMWLAGSAMAQDVAIGLRPPAVPLVTHDPYFSIWSPADRLTDADTMHWTGKPHRLSSLARIDGKTFRLMGKEPAAVPALPQTGLQVLPVRTIYNFEGEGIRLTLTFLTPALPDNIEVLSRPLTYISYEARSTDGNSHAVAFYFDALAELAVNEPRQQVNWAKEGTDQLEVLRFGAETQAVLVRKGDDLRIDWGHLYLAAPKDKQTASYILPAGAARGAFASGGKFSMMNMAMPVTAGEAPAAVIVLDGGNVGAQSVSRWLMIAYDDEYSINYFKPKLRPYWRRGGDNAAALLKKATADYPSLLNRCVTFDEQLLADLRKVGGEKYALLCALAYRQTFAGNKICADASGRPLMFPKENFSNGCISTVDVLFPQAPFFLTMSPTLTKAMLVPVLDYASSLHWPYNYAPHDLGTYPHATGQVYGMGGRDGDRMPVEESGNMLIMLAALARVEGNAEFSRKYWPTLTKWADYLVASGLDPENQLCSADMFGHLPHCANLALKAIIGIGGYAQLCDQLGKKEEARRYLEIARSYAAKWQEMAKDDGRTRLAYHLPGTWGMKHNLIWDRVLGLNLFPGALGDAEAAWYLKVQNKYGLPVDNRTATSLIDWAMWSIAPAKDSKTFEALVEPIFRYVNETPSRVPLSDWYDTTNGKQKGFQARPVVGGIYIRLLADEPAWKKRAGRAEKVDNAWAPPPLASGIFKEIVPTSRKEPVTWRFTTQKPADDWFKPGFDDTAWQSGPGGFGIVDTPGAVVRTKWDGTAIWLRREFVLGQGKLVSPCLLAHWDEDGVVYFNGVLAAELPGWTTEYGEVEITPQAIATLRPGRNTMTVMCRQTTGGQYIDVGIADAVPPLVGP
jgi:hypothetical protein